MSIPRPLPSGVRVLSGLALLAALGGAHGCQKKGAEPGPVSPDASSASSDADLTASATSPSDAPTAATDPTATASAALATVLAAEHRSADNKARDTARHPAETLAFFGVQPQDKIVELWPGGGWYTEILAPFVAHGGGHLTVTLYDKDGPEKYYGTGQAQRMLDRFAAESDTFGDVTSVVVPQKLTFDKKGERVESIEVLPFSLGEPGSVDAVLTFRNSHGWVSRGVAPLVYGEAFKVLRPGGIFGVVQHRAAEGTDPAETSKAGYLSEQAVIDAVTAVGFVLDEKSEINANPKDTRDYAGGVWALPPSLSEGDKDRDKYIAIGESDRMTLRFVKPAT